MKFQALGFILIGSFTLFFNGCAKYYSSAPTQVSIPTVEKKTPVKIDMTQSDWSIVVKVPDDVVRKNVSDALFDNPVFIEDATSNNIMKINVLHSNGHGGAELAGAAITGASLYLIPSVADSDVDIEVSVGEIKNNYKGELVVSQGMAGDALIDKTKYQSDIPLNLLKNLIKNRMPNI